MPPVPTAIVADAIADVPSSLRTPSTEVPWHVPGGLATPAVHASPATSLEARSP